jgi:hypothetical protein
MKTYHRQILTLAGATMAVALLFSGCASSSSSGYKKADKTGEGIAKFGAEVLNAKKSVDSTIKSLDQIAVTASSNPRPAYEQYCKEVSKLESIAEKARKRSQDMKEKGQAYFTQWEQQLAQVKDEEIRKLAQERKAKLQGAFNKIREVTEPLKGQFDPWLSSLKDLQAYLGQDLTIAGVDAAKNLFAKAKSQGLEVQKSMDQLVAELNTLTAAITPAKVPTGGSSTPAAAGAPTQPK